MNRQEVKIIKATIAKGNIIEFNHVHHIGIRSDAEGPILSDMGGIYTLGVQPGTIIRMGYPCSTRNGSPFWP